jgi:AbrB family looped-hinge helix DNA binding protein
MEINLICDGKIINKDTYGFVDSQSGPKPIDFVPQKGSIIDYLSLDGSTTTYVVKDICFKCAEFGAPATKVGIKCDIILAHILKTNRDRKLFRAIDDLGRTVIPMSIRRLIGIKEGDLLHVVPVEDNSGVFIRKATDEEKEVYEKEKDKD